MKISLTEKQIRQLLPFFDRVKATAVLGKPGMLVAQIRWTHNGERRYWMEPGFLPYENAKCIEGKGQTADRLALLPIEPAGNTAPRFERSAPDVPTGTARIDSLAHR